MLGFSASIRRQSTQTKWIYDAHLVEFRQNARSKPNWLIARIIVEAPRFFPLETLRLLDVFVVISHPKEISLSRRASSSDREIFSPDFDEKKPGTWASRSRENNHIAIFAALFTDESPWTSEKHFFLLSTLASSCDLEVKLN